MLISFCAKRYIHLYNAKGWSVQSSHWRQRTLESWSRTAAGLQQSCLPLPPGAPHMLSYLRPRPSESRQCSAQSSSGDAKDLARLRRIRLLEGWLSVPSRAGIGGWMQPLEQGHRLQVSRIDLAILVNQLLERRPNAPCPEQILVVLPGVRCAWEHNYRKPG